jgi:hypothetical protein
MPRLTWVLLGLCACTSTTPPPKPEAKPERPTKVEAKTEPKPDETQWRCTKDDECTQTCALGAVNIEWLRAHENADACDDGCSWKGTQVACRDGGCVTLTKDGDIDRDCTRREKPIFE